VIAVADTYPAVGDNGIDLRVRAEVYLSFKTALRSCPARFGRCSLITWGV